MKLHASGGEKSRGRKGESKRKEKVRWGRSIRGREDDVDSGHFFSLACQGRRLPARLPEAHGGNRSTRSYPLKSHFDLTLCSLQRLSREIRVGKNWTTCVGAALIVVVMWWVCGKGRRRNDITVWHGVMWVRDEKCCIAGMVVMVV